MTCTNLLQNEKRPTASAVQRKSNKAVIFSGISTENTMLFFSAAGMMADSACAVNLKDFVTAQKDSFDIIYARVQQT